MADAPATHTGVHPLQVTLLASVFVVAACGLLYELLAGAMASYLLGDSVLQFSTIIGGYLFSMGIGSWLAQHIRDQLPAHFLRIEIMVGLIGGLTPLLLYLGHASFTQGFGVLLYGLVGITGILVGLEIPLVMRMLRRHVAFSAVVSQVLTVDYLGALAVSVAFPLLLVPHLGMLRTGLLFGMLNIAVGLGALWLFRHQIHRRAAHATFGACAFGLLAIAWVASDPLTHWAERHFYQSPVVYSASTPYQRIVLTRGRDGVRLHLNGNLQFAERDEYRYHEALVHPVMAAYAADGPASGPRRVAILGGGDGMAAREVLRYPGVESITLVELDPAMTRLFSSSPLVTGLNRGALSDPRVRVVNEDAFTWLENDPGSFDVVIVDFPDPSSFSVGKLYTTAFYSLLDRHLAAGGRAVVQTTSPLIARESFWTVVHTLQAVGLRTTPYHALVPSFGEWGFVIASHRPWRMPQSLPGGLRFLTTDGLSTLMHFPPDMAERPTAVNHLSDQVLVHTYAREWGAELP